MEYNGEIWLEIGKKEGGADRRAILKNSFINCRCR